MRAFTELYVRLDETTQTSRKTAAMRDYFARAPAADGAWAVYFLCGRKLKRLVTAPRLRQWAAEAAGIPDWLFEECYEAVGDLAETIALLLPTPLAESERPLHEWVTQVLQPLGRQSDVEQRATLIESWGQLSSRQRFVFNKLVTGGFRVGVSQQLVIRALAEASGLPPAVMAHRLMGQWEPTPEFFLQLLSAEGGDIALSRPYPFCLAHALTDGPEELGAIEDWLVEWKWDGIRAQLMRRQGETFLWSRGEELILDRFPELQGDAAGLPDGTVLDGELVGWKDGQVLPFADLQKRIGRKTVGKKLLKDVPAQFLAFDLLEAGGIDLRASPGGERRAQLERLLAGRDPAARLSISPLVTAESWEDLAAIRDGSRERQVEGLMLKRRDAVYGSGRVTGLWWKWKVSPYSCDAVLIYAQAGHGRRANLYTDYTFAAWRGDQLVPFAKAYSGLTDAEIREVDRFIRQNTLEKFGPVRSVKAELVFELAFENIQPSSRHKSGIAVRFPRILRWRKDKSPAEADTLDNIRALLPRQVPS